MIQPETLSDSTEASERFRSVHVIAFTCLAGLLIGTTGCSAILEAIAQGKQDKDTMRQQLMKQDGYSLVASRGLDNVSEKAFKGRRTKFCTDVVDLSTTNNMGNDVTTAKGKLASASSKLRKDRFYVYAEGSKGTLMLSVPAADKEELVENARKGMICGWSDGEVTDFVPNTVGSANDDHMSNGFHEIALVKWDGIVRVKARGGSAQTVPENTATNTPTSSCSEVKEQPFEKVMNPAFAQEFTGCSVKVKTTFAQAPSMPMPVCALPGTMLMIAGQGKFVAAPKSAADTIVGLKPNDPVVMVGKTKQNQGMPVWCFVADSVEKGE